MPPLCVVVLAAGEGKRMRSALPKVLHPLAGRPLLAHVLAAAAALDPQTVHVVHGHGGETVRDAFADAAVEWVEQAAQLGTGHAVAQAMPQIPDPSTVLVLYGDVPLVNPEMLNRVVAEARGGALAMVTAEVADASGYGRIARAEDGRVVAIVEERDASEQQLAINEINTGILALGSVAMRAWLADLGNDNAQGEYYLTDLVARAVAEGTPVVAVKPRCNSEVQGVNDRVQLAALEREYQRAAAERLMRAGATLADPARIDIRGEVEVADDVSIDVNVILEGKVTLCTGARVGPNVTLRDATVGVGAEVLANCVVEGASLGPGSRVGPFSRVRPGTRTGAAVHIGNFVEVKNTVIGDGSKANHLSYLGDAEIGSRVNVGAGTITCNYDGAAKHRTEIGDDVFVGSGVELVAPVVVASNATIGAGSTISKDAPADALTVSRSRQITVRGWRRPRKKQA